MTDFVKADRLAKVKVSEIVVMSEAARKRRAEGHDVINLGIGEPDFDTPDHANDAAIAAINHHDTHYPPIAGKPELREAIAALYDGRGGTIRRPRTCSGIQRVKIHPSQCHACQRQSGG